MPQTSLGISTLPIYASVWSSLCGGGRGRMKASRNIQRERLARYSFCSTPTDCGVQCIVTGGASVNGKLVRCRCYVAPRSSRSKTACV